MKLQKNNLLKNMHLIFDFLIICYLKKKLLLA